MNSQSDNMLSISFVAKKLNVSRSTILSLIKHNEISAVKIGKVWRIYQSDLEEYWQEQQNTSVNNS